MEVSVLSSVCSMIFHSLNTCMMAVTGSKKTKPNQNNVLYSWLVPQRSVHKYASWNEYQRRSRRVRRTEYEEQIRDLELLIPKEGEFGATWMSSNIWSTFIWRREKSFVFLKTVELNTCILYFQSWAGSQEACSPGGADNFSSVCQLPTIGWDHLEQCWERFWGWVPGSLEPTGAVIDSDVCCRSKGTLLLRYHVFHILDVVRRFLTSARGIPGRPQNHYKSLTNPYMQQMFLTNWGNNTSYTTCAIIFLII